MQIGDMVQWTVNGVDQFVEPKRIKLVSSCGGWCFVEGSNTGLPVNQLTLCQEEFTFFWHGPFSQWHPSRFVVNDIVYNCCEQYMMASKARLFNDHQALHLILESDSPRYQKSIGRQVRNFNENRWNDIARDFVYIGNKAKFTQNPQLWKQLKETKGTLVEASQYDRIWGVGLSMDDPRILRRQTWRGKNWLGEILTSLRDDLIRNGN